MVVVERAALLRPSPSTVVPLADVAHPQTSVLRDHPPAAVPVAPRMRVRCDGAIVVLAEDRRAGRAAPHVLERDREPSPPAVFDAADIVDVLPAPDGAWLLERSTEGDLVLRRLDRAGTTLWARPAIDKDVGCWERLLGDDDGSAYAVVRDPRTAVARIDDDGRPRGWRELAGLGADPVMNGHGQIGWVAIDSPGTAPVWHILAPGARLPQRAPLPEQAGGPSSITVGLDGDGRVYAVDATTLLCVSPGLRREWSVELQSIALSADGAVVTASQTAAELDLTVWRDRAVAERVRVPAPRVGDDAPPWWHVIARDRGSWVLWAGTGLGRPGILARVGDDGHLAEVVDPAPTDARLHGWWSAPAHEWQVDDDGRAHISVAGPDGVAIVRIAGG